LASSRVGIGYLPSSLNAVLITADSLTIKARSSAKVLVARIALINAFKLGSDHKMLSVTRFLVYLACGAAGGARLTCRRPCWPGGGAGPVTNNGERRWFKLSRK
jgi:hypothetical protein